LPRKYNRTSTIPDKTDPLTHTRRGRELCGAKKRNGDRCMAYAGWGTDHVGIGRCKQHGGATPAHRIRAERIRAEQAMAAQYGTPVNVAPSDALLWVVQATAGHCNFLGRQIADLEKLTGNRAHVLLQLYGEERDRLTRASKAALDAGVAERQVRLAEHYGEFIAGILVRVFEDLRLNPAQQKRAPDIVQRVLLAAESSAGAAL